MRALLFLLLALATSAAHAADRALTIFAAASLTEAFRDAGTAWHQAGHPAPVFSFAGSSTLARQIAAGAPADVFVSADAAWMDQVEKSGRVVPGTRADIAGNRLVLVAAAGREGPVPLRADALTALLGPTGRLAIGDPAHVPAGIYARQALTRLGLWSTVATRLAPAADVRAALLLVSRGETPAGIVYATDAAAAPTLAVLATFPAPSHDPIRYPAAAIAGVSTDQARAFLAFLRAPAGRAILARRGFLLP